MFVYNKLKLQETILTTTGLNFIGGDDDDDTILCVEERGNTKLWLAEFGVFWAEPGRNDVGSDAEDVWGGFEEVEEDDEESILLEVDFALGMEDKGWKKESKNMLSYKVLYIKRD